MNHFESDHFWLRSFVHGGHGDGLEEENINFSLENGSCEGKIEISP